MSLSILPVVATQDLTIMDDGPQFFSRCGSRPHPLRVLSVVAICTRFKQTNRNKAQTIVPVA